MKNDFNSCALCESQWGDVWCTVQNQKLFFCCEICAISYENLVLEILKTTKWPRLDNIKINGNPQRSRQVTVDFQDEVKHFSVTFLSTGKIMEFSTNKTIKN